MDDLQLSISRFLDGELTDEETRQLAEVLHTNVESLDQFLLSNYIHYQLLDWMDQERVPDHDMDGRFDDRASASFGAASAHAGTPAENQRHLGRVAHRWLRAWGALAATLLVAVSIAAVSYVMATRPVYVGLLSDATGCSWANVDRGLPIGTMLEEGQQLDLLKGNAVITFSSGAKVMLEGPASLRIKSPMEVQLISGLIASKVPRQAVGFKVDSSLAQFIDLGTAFTLNLASEESFELHVFEGMVEVRVDERFGKAAQRPAYIAEVHAISFDIKSGDIEKLHFKEGKEMPF